MKELPKFQINEKNFDSLVQVQQCKMKELPQQVEVGMLAKR